MSSPVCSLFVDNMALVNKEQLRHDDMDTDNWDDSDDDCDEDGEVFFVSNIEDSDTWSEKDVFGNDYFARNGIPVPCAVSMDTVSSDQQFFNQQDVVVTMATVIVDTVSVPSTSSPASGLTANQDKQGLDGDGNNKLQCSFDCGEWFHERWQLKRHETVHIRENRFGNFQCSYCDYKCIKKVSMDCHTVRVHTKLFKHVCFLCGQGFHYPWELSRHTKKH